MEEYYIYDPETIDLIGWLRSENELTIIEEMNNWVSPRLGIRFQLQPDTLEIYHPDGEHFLTPVELEQQRLQERQRADQAEARVQRLEARLRELGIDPNQL